MSDVAHEVENGWLYFDYRKGAGACRNGELINAARAYARPDASFP